MSAYRQKPPPRRQTLALDAKSAALVKDSMFGGGNRQIDQFLKQRLSAADYGQAYGLLASALDKLPRPRQAVIAADAASADVRAFLERKLSRADLARLTDLVDRADLAQDGLPRIVPKNGAGSIPSKIADLVPALAKTLTSAQLSELRDALTALLATGAGAPEEAAEKPTGAERHDPSGLADLAQDGLPRVQQGDAYGEQPRDRRIASKADREAFAARHPAAARITAI